MKAQTSIRLDAGHKALFQRAATQAREDLTEFLVNSALLRIQQRQLKAKPRDPMALMEDLYLQPYDPSALPAQDALAVSRMNARAAKGALQGKALGSAKVRPPKRGR